MEPNFSSMLPGGVLAALLAAAIWHDVRTRRIPNLLVLTGALIACALHATMAKGAAMFAVPLGMGLLFALSGLGAGLLVLLPSYALRTMGAGDVKLMAMIGAFLGPEQVIGAALLSMLAGGVLALVVAVWTGQLARVLDNVHHMLLSALLRGMAGTDARVDASAQTTGKLAYAIAIGCGTVVQLLVADAPAWRLFSCTACL